MRLISGTIVIVKLDGKEYRFTLVAADGDGDGRLNIAAPLARLLGAMGPGNTVKAWTPSRIAGAETMRVELVKVIQ